uniref:Uncharacterized protein n=1 Tax=Romanomermis culicivorax TaxID=13658 RepID=A0A915L9Y7_ROMCU
MLSEITRKISISQLMPLNCRKPILESIPTISVVNEIGVHAVENRPRENTYAVYPNQHFLAPWEQHIHYNALPAPYVTTPTDSSHASSQSSKLQLVLPALPSSAMVTVNTPDTCALNQSTSAANMVIPSKEIASTAPIMSPGIVCWNTTGHAFGDPCHIRSSIC